MNGKRVLIAIVFAGWTGIGLAQGTGGGSAEPDSELKNYGNWSVQCVRNEETKSKNCVLFQQLILESGQRLLSMQINKATITTDDTTPDFVVILNTPLGVHLPSGARIQIDKAEPVDLVYERCDRAGCYAGVPVDEGLQTALTKGKACNVTITNLLGKTITGSLSLKGFTDGFATL